MYENSQNTTNEKEAIWLIIVTAVSKNSITHLKKENNDWKKCNGAKKLEFCKFIMYCFGKTNTNSCAKK